jgi:vancomycin permeability regulator SanA
MCDMLQDRVNIAVQLVNKGVSDRILMSGDHGKVEYDEVNSMMQYSIDKGMDENKVFLDHAGFSTYESMYRARDVFACKKIVIVTQGFHLYRAVYDARALGLEAYGVASDSRDYGDQDPLYLREDLARCKDFIYCIFQPEPTYLGSCIPIYGDSSATKDK